MVRLLSLLLVSLLALAACDTSSGIQSTGSSASGLSTKVYHIRNRDVSKIQYRMLDSVNSLRQAAGLQPVTLNAQLTAAAATHSRDMSVQNRPWHFGSDGSSPLDRVRRAGYYGEMLGENISETYETELETLAAWMDEPGTRAVLLDKNARDLGFAWYQEPAGKIWWTLLMGSGRAPVL
ncbi:divisome-associated lipoprotein DalA [Pseudodonghicola xiamenensis]|uniref:CAP domain-containing protein n=1 Tax=Pseudodonghicola xiamenensis TaxID=337702 RepID=UPI0005589CA8|nr:CAP domain-containing protein [Pseudodonghicola xiamenensis]